MTPATPKDGLPVLAFDDQAAWEAWLALNSGAAGVWLQIGKAGCSQPSVSYAEALETALCWGWIDGQKKGWDDCWWLQRFTPRGAHSKWSRINREKAEALIDAGRMQPSGLAEVSRAQQDGRWQAAYDSQSQAVVPEDLQAALDANPQAAAFFGKLNSTNRYAILYRIQTAARAETRSNRIEKYVQMLKRGETIYPQ